MSRSEIIESFFAERNGFARSPGYRVLVGDALANLSVAYKGGCVRY